MTSPRRIAALCDGVEHVVSARVPGALVECGVWKGGSMMAAALTLLRLGVSDRDLYLFDTFQGMPPPTHHDVFSAYDGYPPMARWRRGRRGERVALLPGRRVRGAVLSTAIRPSACTWSSRVRPLPSSAPEETPAAADGIGTIESTSSCTSTRLSQAAS